MTDDPTLRILSLGAGVQSTALALMACDGTLPGLDAAIFADTGWEPLAVYQQVDRLETELHRAGIPLHRVSKGNLRIDTVDGAARFVSVPWFIRNPDGSEGMGRRQCTAEYKLSPIMRSIRTLLGAAPPDYRSVPRGRVAEQWIGFSTDEIVRVDDKRANLYTIKRYPLLEMDMSRKACQRWLTERGWGHTAKSACIGCPLHGNAAWRRLRDTCECGHHRDAHQTEGLWCEQVMPPDGDYSNEHRCECPGFRAPQWEDAVEFDRRIRKGGARGDQLRGEAFLHRSRVPLDLAPIDRVTRREYADLQLDLFEDGDPDGCSPYGCRSGEPVQLDVREDA